MISWKDIKIMVESEIWFHCFRLPNRSDTNLTAIDTSAAVNLFYR